MNRKRAHDRTLRSKLQKKGTKYSWPFAQLGTLIAYKAQKAGVPVIYVDPAYTSQECSQYHHTARTNRTSQARFACKVCVFVEHVDHNSSHNISRRGWMAWVCGTGSTAQPSHSSRSRFGA
ncbi:zinc ribbon domain-containing protein [Streptomyces sp. BBFR51]|uniref:zinc ribbon domain-containing protein n=1 Tax=Streptomyces sp. BBFR51 TaxID=3372856 RepID=UPI0037DC12EF